jgi:hypothetical protein
MLHVQHFTLLFKTKHRTYTTYMTHIYTLLKYTVLIQRATTPHITLYTILRHQEEKFKSQNA